MMSEAQSTPLVTIATSYALRGWRVFPLLGKIPAIPGGAGCLDATDDVDAIRAWWRQCPDANIGIATGPDSGLVVVDLDGGDARRAWLDLTNRCGPFSTLTAQTGRTDGGIHVYLRWPRGEHVPNHAQGGWSERVLGHRAMEVIGDGRYVVAPGSLHKSGARYRWLDADASVAEMPEWLAERLCDRAPTVVPTTPWKPTTETDMDAARSYCAAALRKTHDRVAALARGERNASLVKEAFNLAGYIHTRGLTDYEIRDALRSACATWGTDRDPPKDHATIDRGIEAGKSKPRPIPEKRHESRSAAAAWHAQTDAATDTPASAFEPFVPFEEGGVLPSFPVHALPAWIAEYASAVAASTRFSVDMACGFALGAVSAALGGCIEVAPGSGENPQWREPVNLFVAIVAEPGEGKSPVFSRMMAPIFDLDRELNEKHSKRFARDSEDRKVLESRIAKARSALEKNTHDSSALAELHRLAEEASTPVKAIPQLAVGDVTGEQLGQMLQEQDERLAVLSPEDTLWQHAGGRYNKESPSIEVYLSGYSGEEVRVNRASRKVMLRNPSLTICVAMQPAVLLGRGSKLADDRGLMARFLFVAPPRVVGTRDHSTDPPEIPAHVEARYRAKLGSIASANLEVARKSRLMVRLTPDAQVAWRAWQNDLEKRRTEDGDLYVIRGWAAKADGFALRLAGLLAIASDSLTVDAAMLRHATTLVEYFAAHAKVSIGAALADDEVRLAVRLLGWLRRRVERSVRSDTPDDASGTPDGFFTPRDAWKGNKSWMTSARSKAACEVLRDHGYLRAATVGKAAGYVPHHARIVGDDLG